MSEIEPNNTNIPPPLSDAEAMLRTALAGRHLVLVGLMGAGKTSVGKRLATRLHLPFIDSDSAIEQSANMSVSDIFSLRGEAEFRTGERRVISRLLSEPQQIIATGGGAYMDPQTRDAIKAQGISLWLKAELPVLMRRVMRRADRPLLQTSDPEVRMRELMDMRHPIYAQADVTVLSFDQPHDAVVEAALAALSEHLGLDRYEPRLISHPSPPVMEAE